MAPEDKGKGKSKVNARTASQSSAGAESSPKKRNRIAAPAPPSAQKPLPPNLSTLANDGEAAKKRRVSSPAPIASTSFTPSARTEAKEVDPIPDDSQREVMLCLTMRTQEIMEAKWEAELQAAPSQAPIAEAHSTVLALRAAIKSGILPEESLADALRRHLSGIDKGQQERATKLSSVPGRDAERRCQLGNATLVAAALLEGARGAISYSVKSTPSSPIPLLFVEHIFALGLANSDIPFAVKALSQWLPRERIHTIKNLNETPAFSHRVILSALLRAVDDQPTSLLILTVANLATARAVFVTSSALITSIVKDSQTALPTRWRYASPSAVKTVLGTIARDPAAEAKSRTLVLDRTIRTAPAGPGPVDFRTTILRASLTRHIEIEAQRKFLETGKVGIASACVGRESDGGGALHVQVSEEAVGRKDGIIDLRALQPLQVGAATGTYEVGCIFMGPRHKSAACAAELVASQTATGQLAVDIFLSSSDNTKTRVEKTLQGAFFLNGEEEGQALHGRAITRNSQSLRRAWRELAQPNGAMAFMTRLKLVEDRLVALPPLHPPDRDQVSAVLQRTEMLELVRCMLDEMPHAFLGQLGHEALMLLPGSERKTRCAQLLQLKREEVANVKKQFFRISKD